MSFLGKSTVSWWHQGTCKSALHFILTDFGVILASGKACFDFYFSCKCYGQTRLLMTVDFEVLCNINSKNQIVCPFHSFPSFQTTSDPHWIPDILSLYKVINRSHYLNLETFNDRALSQIYQLFLICDRFLK